MIIKKIKGKILEGILAGAVVLGICGNKADSQTFAPKNANSVELGVYNDSFEWNNGGVVDMGGGYVQLNRGLSDRVTGYVEMGVANPVFNDVALHRGSDKKADISPNNHIAYGAIGLRTKFYERDKSAVCGDFRLSQVSEFNDFHIWSLTDSTEYHVDGITTLGADIWYQKRIKDFNVRMGIGFKSSYAEGENLTYQHRGDNHETEYSGFNERDKASLQGILGVDYKSNDGWKIMSTLRGSHEGLGFRLGVGKDW